MTRAFWQIISLPDYRLLRKQDEHLAAVDATVLKAYDPTHQLKNTTPFAPILHVELPNLSGVARLVRPD